MPGGGIEVLGAGIQFSSEFRPATPQIRCRVTGHFFRQQVQEVGQGVVIEVTQILGELLLRALVKIYGSCVFHSLFGFLISKLPQQL